jgi:hypothetical protein
MLINLIIFRSLRIGDIIGGDVVKGETIRWQIVSGGHHLRGDTTRCETSLMLNAVWHSKTQIEKTS